MKHLTLLLMIGMVAILPGSGSACTSFATYANGPLYGMNFDYPASAMVRFVIETHGDLKVFHLTFWKNNHFASTVGMNSAGLFISDQILEGDLPELQGPIQKGLYPWRLYRWALNSFSTVAEVRQYLADRRLVHDPFLGLHLLVADSTGDALVAEVGTSTNALLGIAGDFIVMTNFSNEANLGLPCDEVVGVGADRYRITHEGLSRQGPEIDMAGGMEILAQANNRASGWPTRTSLVFDPVRGEVFIALERDYEHIWKVSLMAGTIETHQGFAEQRVIPLGAQGILAAALK